MQSETGPLFYASKSTFLHSWVVKDRWLRTWMPDNKTMEGGW